MTRLLGQQPDDPVAQCYARLAVHARRPEFYRWSGVPDTLDGRFDLLALHAFLVLHRLKRQGEPARRFSRRLVEVMVADIDRTVPAAWGGIQGEPRLRALARGFGGRIHAYDHSLATAGVGPAVGWGDDRERQALAAALRDNLYRAVPTWVAGGVMAGMAWYVRAALELLAGQPLERVLAGDVRFPEPPLPVPVGGAKQGGWEVGVTS